MCDGNVIAKGMFTLQTLSTLDLDKKWTVALDKKWRHQFTVCHGGMTWNNKLVKVCRELPTIEHPNYYRSSLFLVDIITGVAEMLFSYQYEINLYIWSRQILWADDKIYDLIYDRPNGFKFSRLFIVDMRTGSMIDSGPIDNRYLEFCDRPDILPNGNIMLTGTLKVKDTIVHHHTCVFDVKTFLFKKINPAPWSIAAPRRESICVSDGIFLCSPAWGTDAYMIKNDGTHKKCKLLRVVSGARCLLLSLPESKIWILDVDRKNVSLDTTYGTTQIYDYKNDICLPGPALHIPPRDFISCVFSL
jgi:hypothetical protein